MARHPATGQVQVNFRMPADLKARIEAAAEANNRTTTAELVATLEEKYPAPTPEMLKDLFSSLLTDIEALPDGKEKNLGRLYIRQFMIQAVTDVLQQARLAPPDDAVSDSEIEALEERLRRLKAQPENAPLFPPRIDE